MITKKLHPTRQSLLDLLAKHHDDPLTIREMQEELNISSTSVVMYHLAQLEKNGYLKRDPYNPRSYQVLKDSPEKRITYLNLYGLAQCGPRGNFLEDSPIDKIGISSRVLSFAASDAFLVKAKGDSMTPKINEGDLVITQKADDVASGTVAVCVNDGEALIKKVQKPFFKIFILF